MAKIDAPPPFKMVIENGHLVPVAAWDAERLATYRNGSVVSVRLTQEKNRKLERKYWAILGEVIKNCPVKQRTTEDLHKAIRLKLGVVDAFFSIDGNLRVEIKSTSGMEEPEYREFFEDAMGLLHEITGVDPITLHKESAEVGEDEPSEAAPLSATDEGSGTADPSTSSAADPIASQGVNGEAEQSNAGDGPAASSASSDPIVRNLSVECLDKFMAIATDAKLSVQERRDNLEFAKEPWKDALPTRHDFVKACLTTADKVAKGELGADAARRYLDGLI